MKRLVGICVAFIIMFGVGSNAQAANFTPRTSAPSSNDYHYFSDNIFCISGIGMPNCTAYAWGRAYELLGSKPRLSTGNAGKWWNYNINNGYYSYGSEPKLGAIACWDHYDNNTGHVAVVEAINGNDITISESNYEGVYWRMVTIPKNGVYGSLHFQGYIYIGDFGGGGQIPEPVNDLHAEKNLFSCNEYIEFSWSPSAGATHYYLYMWKDGIQIYMLNNQNNTAFTSAPTSAGKYTLIIRPGNDYGYNDNSKAFEFEVYDTIPEAVTDLHAARNRYSKNEYIEFSWSPSAGATHYYLYMWKDGTQIYMLNNGNNTAFTSAPTSPGKYTLIIRPGNDFGYNDNSKAFNFEVYDPDVVPTATPEPTPTPKEPEIPIKTRVITKTATENLSLVNTVYAELENLAARDIGCDVIIVYKYADGSIAKTDIQTVTVPSKQTLNAESSVSNRIIDLGGNLVNSVEVYVWNSADGMIPLAEKKIGNFDYDY